MDSDYPFILWILIIHLFYGFWLSIYFMDSDYPFILWILIIHLFYGFWLSIYFMDSDYPFGICSKMNKSVYIYFSVHDAFWNNLHQALESAWWRLFQKAIVKDK